MSDQNVESVVLERELEDRFSLVKKLFNCEINITKEDYSYLIRISSKSKNSLGIRYIILEMKDNFMKEFNNINFTTKELSPLHFVVIVDIKK